MKKRERGEYHLKLVDGEIALIHSITQRVVFIVGFGEVQVDIRPGQIPRGTAELFLVEPELTEK